MPNPASYTRTTWVSGVTPADATELNNIEDGLVALYSNTPQTGGNNTFTGLQTDEVTLSGSDQKVHSFAATDGKTYSLYIRSNNHFALHNDTDSIWVWEIDPTGNLTLAGALSIASAIKDASGN